MADRTLADQLRGLGVLVEEVAANLAGFSALPAAGGNLTGELVPALDETLLGAWDDLVVHVHGLANVATRLAMMRGPYLQRQVEALGLGDAPRDLQLCLTGHAPPPWITVGFPPARVTMNLAWGLPFPAGSARYVYFALALEHFYYEHHARAILVDIRRTLAPGGVLRVVVPDLEKYIRAYAAGDEAFFTRHRALWPWAQHMHTPIDYLLGMAGAGMGRGPGGFFDHKTGYDFAALSRLLAAAGFSSVVRRDYMQSDHPALRLDHTSHDASYAHDDQNLNLFVEATA